MDPQDQNNSINNASKQQSPKKKKNFVRDISHITSLKDTLNQEVQFQDKNNERFLKKLSTGDLNNKVKMYNNLYSENKINTHNAFEIDIISCVQQMVKRTKEANFLEISNTFDAISKVYSCRVDDVWAACNTLVKDFVTESKNKMVIEEKETNTKLKIRKKLMLTTAEKLHCRENGTLPYQKYLSVDLDDDIINYTKPSRILINKYSNKAYWPEYDCSKNIEVNENQEGTYEMEDISCLLENGQICPSFHKFVSEHDKSTNDDNDLMKLNNIVTHFNQDTSKFCDANSEELNDLVDVDINEPNSEIIVHKAASSSNNNNKPFSRQDSLDSISQTLLALDTEDCSDYTFFDRTKMSNLKFPNHWKEKCKMMTTNSKQKSLHIKSHVVETESKTNDSEYQCSNSKATHFKVDFNLDISTTLEQIRLDAGHNKCSHSLWKPSNNLISSSDELNIMPIKQLTSCKYINMIPNWFKNEFETLNCKTNPNSVFLFPEQYSPNNSLLEDEVPVEYIDVNAMNIDHDSQGENEEYEITREVNDDNNFTKDINKYIIDDAHEELEFPTSNSEDIDMHQLKIHIMNIIKPKGEKTINIKFADLLHSLPKLLPENMKKCINVSIIYVALCHLCSEHNLCLENKGDETFISQGPVNSQN